MKNCFVCKSKIKKKSFASYENTSQYYIDLETQNQEKEKRIKQLEEENAQLKQYIAKSDPENFLSETDLKFTAKQFKQELKKICQETKIKLSFFDNRIRYSFKSQTLNNKGQPVRTRISFSFDINVIHFKHRLGEIVSLINWQVREVREKLPGLTKHVNFKIVYLDEMFFIKSSDVKYKKSKRPTYLIQKSIAGELQKNISLSKLASFIKDD